MIAWNRQHVGSRWLGGGAGLVFAPVVAILSVACSGGSSPPPSPAPAASAVPVSQPGLVTVTGRAPRGAVVSLEPVDGASPRPPTGPAVVDQRGQQFLPDLLVAQVGQPVEFRNGESIPHNVYVVRAGGGTAELNVSTDPGQAYTHVFTRPGLYDLSCDIHPSMRAAIVVVKTPDYAVSGDFGSYVIMNVAPGRYRVVTLAGTEAAERIVDVAGAHANLDQAGR